MEFQFWPLIERIFRAVPSGKGSKILEIGCGAGDIMQYLKNRGYNVIGLEKEERAIETARKRGVEVFQIEGTDIQAVPGIDRKKFNCIYMHRVMEDPVMSEYDAVQLSSSIARAVKKGKHIFVSTANGIIHTKGFYTNPNLEIVSDETFGFSSVGKILTVKRT